MDPKEIVRAGFDAASQAYREDDAEDGIYGEWLAELSPLIPKGGSVLDLGCGNGIPVARWLADKGFNVVGVDMSPVQIARAMALVPEAHFECADMSALDYKKASFDAIVAFYSIIHLPLGEQPALFGRIARWLRPGAPLLATVGDDAWTGTEEDWQGTTMYWSHADRDNLPGVAHGRRPRKAAWDRFVPEGKGGHTLVLARKPSP